MSATPLPLESQLDPETGVSECRSRRRYAVKVLATLQRSGSGENRLIVTAVPAQWKVRRATEDRAAPFGLPLLDRSPDLCLMAG